MKKIIKEINNNINLKENIPKYGECLMKLYNKCALVEMTMDYYTFYEILCDGEQSDDKLQNYTDEFNNILKENLFKSKSEDERQNVIERIDKLRNKVYNSVSILIAYADIFSRYEYVSNRFEYMFKNNEKYGKISDEDFTREIMQYIFEDEDNAAINSKISEVIAELPLRLTKSKFFQLLSDGLSVYSKTDKTTIDDFVYMLKTSALLELPQNMNEYEELNEIYNDIKNIDYSELTEEKFRGLDAKLQYAAVYINEETDLLMLLQGIINKMYVIMLTEEYTDNDDREIKACTDVIMAINDNFSDTEYISLPDDITDMFVFLEGVPENMYEKLQSVEYVLDNIRNNHLSIVKEIMADNIYKGLFISQNLITDSLFVDISDVQSIFEDSCDKEDDFDGEKYISVIRDEMTAGLTEFFKNNQKPVNKSVMAVILSSLPVFFNNITEVQDYIYNSLSGCTNMAEKQAATEIIKSIINEN